MNFNFLNIPFYPIKSLKFMFTDKKILALSFAPVFIGIVCYFFIGRYIFTDLNSLGSEYLKQHFQRTTWPSYIFFTLLSVFFIFLLNWTFFILVSIISSPFNQFISSLVADKYRVNVFVDNSFLVQLKYLPKNLITEIVKMIFIFLFIFLSLVISFLFPPLSFLITALVLALSFVDYSWSRNSFNLQMCFRDLSSNFLTYILGGSCFILLISIPFLNILFLPLAVVFFTVSHCEKKRTINYLDCLQYNTM